MVKLLLKDVTTKWRCCNIVLIQQYFHTLSDLLSTDILSKIQLRYSVAIFFTVQCRPLVVIVTPYRQ